MALKLLGVVSLTLGVWVLLLLGTPLAWAASRLGRWRAACMRLWGRGLAAVVGMRIRRLGSPPSTPTLLVANHLSYLDIPLLGATTGFNFVSKAEVSRWPLLGPAARSAGTVFVDRGRKRQLVSAARAMERVLAQGQGLCLFPEGTSSGGSTVEPFRSSLLEPAAEAQLPVAYAALSYTAPPGWPPASESLCWWGEMTLAPHLLNLLRMPGFEATVRFGERPLVDSDRKLLAAKLHRAVAGLFHPSMEAREACPTPPS